jgi:cytidylate kinase
LDQSRIVVTVAGPHGSGRTTQAKTLSEALGLRYVSAGSLFREHARELGLTLKEASRKASEDRDFDNYLDRRTREEAAKGGVVIDATLSGWMAEGADLRIYLSCPLAERVRRIAEREGRSSTEVLEETRIREDCEVARFKEFYGVDLENLSIYDLVVNTSLFDAAAVSRILKNVVAEYVGCR